MVYIIISAILIFAFLFVRDLYKKDSSKEEHTEVKTEKLPSRAGCTEYYIAGLPHANIRRNDLGIFHGFANAEIGNRYDKYAISINNGKKNLGYFPGKNRMLHTFITEKGGILPVFGKIWENDEGGHYGRVYIEYDELNYSRTINVQKRKAKKELSSKQEV